MAVVSEVTGRLTRLEINFCRLLAQCNQAVSGGEEKTDEWRLEAYVKSLEGMLADLKQNPSRPKTETLIGYAKQVEFLKGIINADKLASPSERAMATQLLSPGPRSSATLSAAASSSGTRKPNSREIHLRKTAQYNSEMRKELLGNAPAAETDGGGSGGLRRRTPTTPQDDDYDALLKRHQNMQEKIAEEMVSFARNLKENSLLAGTIVRKDTETLEKTIKLADHNYDRLKVESVRLEKHTKVACSWWIWIMLAVVCFTFLWMIMFMKLFPKKTL